MNSLRYNEFVFSPRYRIHRHVIFWTLHTLLWALFWTAVQFSFTRNLVHMIVWLPAMMLYCYPLMYWFIPSLLLKGKYLPFILVALCWAVAGWYLNIGFRAYIFIPFQEKMGYSPIVLSARQPGSYLALTTTAGITGILVIFKHWMKKQQEGLQMEKEKLASEIRLLKAQIHPHFLFNSLNNIYAFSLGQSPKTPTLILRLSSLLSYMLYECKEEEVLLEKEINIMRDYIDLEKERYGNRIDISWSIQGDVSGRYIAPLLLLPFLENAFKHGASEQLEKPWLSVEISLEGDVLRCKMLNSKNNQEGVTAGGIGIRNVQKRLEYLYPSKHELKLTDNDSFFMVSLLIHLHQVEKASKDVRVNEQQIIQNATA